MFLREVAGDLRATAVGGGATKNVRDDDRRSEIGGHLFRSGHSRSLISS
jgi:hypothetical protein